MSNRSIVFDFFKLKQSQKYKIVTYFNILDEVNDCSFGYYKRFLQKCIELRIMDEVDAKVQSYLEQNNG